MNYTLPLLIILPLSASALSDPAPQIGSGEKDGYQLVWQDLFDADDLNPERWYIEVNGNGGGNDELQYYTDRLENVRVGDDGCGNHCLILTARREEYQGRHFTSGRINSHNRTIFTHGKLEASIKLPKTANGLWPAFWMMGNDFYQVGWPKCGETDILEMGHINGINSGTSERYFNGAAHWGPAWPQLSHAQSSTKSYSLQDGEFHLYTLIWDEERMRMYVDLDERPNQNPYYELKCPVDDPDNEKSPGNYFHKDNFIIFNLAVGGNFPAIHNAVDITALNDDNNQEASMYVNYVKIYQKGLTSENLDAITKGDEIGTSGLTPVLALRDTINYNGKEICSEIGCLTLFSCEGQCVARAEEGIISTDNIAPGFYMACDGNTTRKIMVANR